MCKRGSMRYLSMHFHPFSNSHVQTWLNAILVNAFPSIFQQSCANVAQCDTCQCISIHFPTVMCKRGSMRYLSMHFHPFSNSHVQTWLNAILVNAFPSIFQQSCANVAQCDTCQCISIHFPTVMCKRGSMRYLSMHFHPFSNSHVQTWLNAILVNAFPSIFQQSCANVAQCDTCQCISIHFPTVMCKRGSMRYLSMHFHPFSNSHVQT